MAFLNNIEQLRAVEWSSSYLWDIRFSGQSSPPRPFNKFFPAQDVEENLTTLESYQFDLNHKSVKIPHKSSLRTLQITFSDDEQNTLLSWLHEWIDGVIFNGNGGSVAVLEEAVRRVDLVKMDARRDVIQTSSYWVYPEGPLTFSGTSEAKMHQYNIQFIIAGRIGLRPSNASVDFTNETIRTSTAPKATTKLRAEDIFGTTEVENQNGSLGRE